MLTLSEMAVELRCTVKTFSKDVKEKGVPFVGVGKRKRFDPVAVKHHLAQFENSSKVKHSPIKPKHARSQGRSKFADALGL